MPAHSGQGRPRGARRRPFWTGQSEARKVPSQGNAECALRDPGALRSLRLWLTSWDWPGVASVSLSPGHLWPRSAGPAGPLLLTHPEPGGGWGRFFLPPFQERGGPAPSHRPDVSRGGSEDLPEARGRRVQRKKPALGSLGAPQPRLGAWPPTLLGRQAGAPTLGESRSRAGVLREGGAGKGRVCWERGHPEDTTREDRRLERPSGEPVVPGLAGERVLRGSWGTAPHRRLRTSASKAGAPSFPSVDHLPPSTSP